MPKPVGLKIKNIRAATAQELETMGWDDSQPLTVIELEDGSCIFAAQDEEFNGPGTMVYLDEDGNVFTFHKDID